MQIDAAWQASYDAQAVLMNSITDERDQAKVASAHWYNVARTAALANQDHVARLGAEIVALRLDAERYQWLRDNSCSVGYPSSEGSENEDAYLVITGYDERYQLTTPQRDEAVDNEMRKQGAKE